MMDYYVKTQMLCIWRIFGQFGFCSRWVVGYKIVS